MTVGTVLGFTSNFRLILVNPNARGYADELHKNLKVIDSVLFAATGISGVSGAWENNTAYIIGDRVVDADDGKLYQCEVNHTSAASGTFLADRTANPTYWSAILNSPIYRGIWQTGIQYNANDFVSDAGRYAVCVTTHTSTTSLDTDIANWDILVDFSLSAGLIQIVGPTPQLVLEDDDAAAGDDFAQFTVTGAEAIIEGTANGNLHLRGYGDVNLTSFTIKWGGVDETIWHGGNHGSTSGLDADLLDGQEGAYYADIASRLGYTPADIAGDTFTAAVTIDGTLTLNDAGGTDAVYSEAGINRTSAGAETFNIQNSGAGAMTVQVDGVEVLTESSANTVTNKSIDLASNTLTGTLAEFNAAMSDGSFTPLGKIGGVNAQTGVAYTLALTDLGKLVTMNNASANAITIPTNAAVAFDQDSWVSGAQIGAGVTTIQGDTGVTVNGVSAGSVEVPFPYAYVTMLKIGTNEWYVNIDGVA